MSMSNEEALKAGDDAINKLRELMERFKDRLTLDNLRLAERYVKGELLILVHMRSSCCPTNAPDFGVIFQGSHILRSKRKWPRKVVRESRDGIASGGPHAGQHDSECGAEIVDHRGIDGCDRHQEAVFVEVVKLMQHPELVIPSLVRFGRIDGLYRGWTHSLYFSRTRGFVFIDALCDREISRLSGNIFVGKDELIGEVVESGSQVMDRVADEERHVVGNVPHNFDTKDLITGLRLLIGSDEVRVGLKKHLLSDFKITDVMLGPFDLQADAGKRSGI